MRHDNVGSVFMSLPHRQKKEFSWLNIILKLFIFYKYSILNHTENRSSPLNLYSQCVFCDRKLCRTEVIALLLFLCKQLFFLCVKLRIEKKAGTVRE